MFYESLRYKSRTRAGNKMAKIKGTKRQNTTQKAMIIIILLVTL